MILFKNPILSLLGTEASTNPCFTVLSCDFNWWSLIILSMIPTNLIRCAGHAQDAMIGTILGCVINIILDPIFLFVFHMEATGVAIATVFSNFVTDAYLVYVIKRKMSRTQCFFKGCPLRYTLHKRSHLYWYPSFSYKYYAVFCSHSY